MNDKRKLLMVLLPAMIIPFASSLFYFVLFSEHTFSRLIYTGTKFFTLIWPVLAYKIILKYKLPKVSFEILKNKINIFKGFLAGLIIIIFMFILMKTELGIIVAASGKAIKLKTEQLGVIKHYWLFGFFLSIFHSLIEEYYWRWFIYGNLSKIYNNYFSHIIAGIAFSAHHIVVASQFFPLFWGVILGLLVGVGGIIFSILYQKQKTLLGAWVCHIVVDLGIFSIGYKLIF